MDKLAEIMAHKRAEVARRVRPVRDEELVRHAERAPGQKRFAQRLVREEGLAVIAEVKRKSPSAGEIAPETLDATEQARRYYNAGADCLSILTDEAFFGGSIRDLWDVNDMLRGRPDTPPTLRKDFFVDPIQVLEAAEAGAGAILIIVRALEDAEMKALRRAADLAGLDSLYEVHSLAELDRAVTHEAKIIGVNNRDLARFTTDLAYSEEIIPEMPADAIAVSESGIWTPEDAARAAACGADAILVGEALMRAEKPEHFIDAVHQSS